MTDTSGLTSATPFGFFDPDSHCLRTSQGTFLWDSTPSSLTLPPSGSMRSGALSERPTLGRATSESDCSSLLPTPRANKPDGYCSEGYGQTITQVATSLLPTPTAQAAKHGASDRGPGTLDDFNLWTVATRMLPTPTARDHKDGAGTPWHPEKCKLPHTIGALLPTPTARESKGQDAPGRAGGASLCETVRTGAHSTPPSTDTPDSPDDPPQLQLTIEDDSAPCSSSG